MLAPGTPSNNEECLSKGTHSPHMSQRILTKLCQAYFFLFCIKLQRIIVQMRILVTMDKLQSESEMSLSLFDLFNAPLIQLSY